MSDKTLDAIGGWAIKGDLRVGGPGLGMRIVDASPPVELKEVIARNLPALLAGLSIEDRRRLDAGVEEQMAQELRDWAIKDKQERTFEDGLFTSIVTYGKRMSIGTQVARSYQGPINRGVLGFALRGLLTKRFKANKAKRNR